MTAAAKENELIKLAKRVLPAGGFGNSSPNIVIQKGKNGRIWDVSGNEYIDLLMGSGPLILGHAHPEVMAAVREQLSEGTTFFANNEHGILLAERIVQAVPCAEQVRFMSSGTEATAYAMRLMRAYSGKTKILRFEGAYHGMNDWSLMSQYATTDTTRPVMDSPGIPEHMGDNVLVAPYNNLQLAKDIIHHHRGDLAGVLVEPLQRLVEPEPNFLQGLRDCTSETGILLAFDEIVTGFRMSYAGAQGYYGIVPDLCTLGKVIGGGFPMSAIVGREDIMAMFDRDKVGAERFMPLIGTLNGNPVSAVAGLATLDILQRPGTYEKLFAIGNAVWNGIETAFNDVGIPVTMSGMKPMFGTLFTSNKTILNHRDMISVNGQISREVNTILREQGIFKGEKKIYVCLTHTDNDIEEIIQAYKIAAASVAKSNILA